MCICRCKRRKKSLPITSNCITRPTERPQEPPDVPVAPARRVGFSLLPWKLARIELPQVARTIPPRSLLTPWDIRVRRYTSPSYLGEYPTLLSPLPLSLERRTSTDKATQTQRGTTNRGTQSTVTKAERGVQHSSNCRTTSTQYESDWEPSYTSRGTQTTYEPPQKPKTDENNNNPKPWGPIRLTKAPPPIT
ncbi:uncharacterized protein [Anoplolepis gracilipes]|uniref:uncharacterized protein isoform X2 n=1 Tax=Anoplolepis gracilipes TaxID=354296 RepID=UPI003BA353F0